MPLCERCSTITLASLLSTEGYLHHDNYASLHASASVCDVCHMVLLHLGPRLAEVVVQELDHQEHLPSPRRLNGFLDGFATPITLRYVPGHYEGVERGEPRKVNRDPTSRKYLDVHCGRPRAVVASKVPSREWSESAILSGLKDVYVMVCVPVFVYEGDPLAELGVQVRQHLAPSPMADGNVLKVKTWISHCSNTHVECRALKEQKKQWPTRLLNLHAAESTGTFQIVNVPSDFREEYVALSYCWGSKHRPWIEYLKTCQRASHRTVEVIRMPQTLQDAVVCCLRLGYRYLWIDCLSILQGNKADWLAEGAKMSEIYANAVLTISASDSKDCKDGFLFDRSTLQREGAVLKLLAGDHSTTGQLHLCPANMDFERLVGDGPVAKRGWCLQERQLSSRVLHICQGEIFFECMRCRRFEGEIAPAAEFDLSDEFLAFHMPITAHDTGRGKPSPNVENIFSWFAIMQDYTRRALAMPEDKLVAVAGLARRAHQVFGAEYLAGLWKKQIHVGLLWMIDEDAFASRAAVYRAPTWSWASMDGPVSWSLIDGWVQSHDGFVESAIGVEDSVIRLDSDDPFGPVHGAELIVRGRLKRIPASKLLPNKVLTYPAWMGSGGSPHIGCYLEDEKKVIEAELITCLKVATRPFGPGPSLPPTNEMIILDKVDGCGMEDMDTYRRVGFGQVLVTEYFDDCVISSMRLI